MSYFMLSVSKSRTSDPKVVLARHISVNKSWINQTVFLTSEQPALH